jgi:hypothetical protein
MTEMEDAKGILSRPAGTPEEVAQTIARAAISAVPLIGSPAAELMALVFGDPLLERRDAWIERIAAVVVELTEKVEGITPESLSNDPAFVTTALHATQVALHNHQEEKLQALQNAVQNSVLPGEPDDDIKITFVHLIDVLTPGHLRLLKFFSDPSVWYRQHEITPQRRTMGGLGIVLEEGIPDLKGMREWYDFQWRDLSARGLTNTDNLHVTLTAASLFEPRLSSFGSRFLKFVEKQI